MSRETEVEINPRSRLESYTIDRTIQTGAETNRLCPEASQEGDLQRRQKDPKCRKRSRTDLKVKQGLLDGQLIEWLSRIWQFPTGRTRNI